MKPTKLAVLLLIATSASMSTLHAVVPTLTSISPNTGLRGTAVGVTFTGTDLTGTSAVSVSGALVTPSSVVVVSSTTVTATLTITGAAALTTRTITVTTPGGVSNSVNFTVYGAVLTSISPTSGMRGTTVPVTFTGTDLSGVTTVTVSGTNVTINTIVIVNSTTVTCNLVVGASATLSTRTISLSGSNGTTGTVNFTVLGPTLTSISPSSAFQSTAPVVTLTGTGLTSATSVTVTGTGVTVSGMTVINDTTVTATFTITSSATVSARNVAVVATIGTTSTVTFTVVATPTPGMAIQLRDGQATPHYFTIRAPSTLPTNVICDLSITGFGACAGDVAQGYIVLGKSNVNTGTPPSIAAPGMNVWYDTGTVTSSIMSLNPSGGGTQLGALALTGAGVTLVNRATVGGTIVSSITLGTSITMGAAVTPSTNNTFSVGDSTHAWTVLYAEALTANNGALNITGAGASNGNITFTPGAVATNASSVFNAARVDQPAVIVNNHSGTTTSSVWEIRNASAVPVVKILGATDASSPNAFTISGEVSPITSAAYTLGNSTHRWNKAWIVDEDVSGTAIFSSAPNITATSAATPAAGFSLFYASAAAQVMLTSGLQFAIAGTGSCATGQYMFAVGSTSTTCFTVNTGGPITFNTGSHTWDCPTCLTTAGGQTVSGVDVFSASPNITATTAATPAAGFSLFYASAAAQVMLTSGLQFAIAGTGSCASGQYLFAIGATSTTCFTINTAGPITFNAGSHTWDCPTCLTVAAPCTGCLTTAGGQTITGVDIFSAGPNITATSASTPGSGFSLAYISAAPTVVLSTGTQYPIAGTNSCLSGQYMLALGSTTVTCKTVNVGGPITFNVGSTTWDCPTCLVTGGGQTISGVETFGSTLMPTGTTVSIGDSTHRFGGLWALALDVTVGLNVNSMASIDASGNGVFNGVSAASLTATAIGNVHVGSGNFYLRTFSGAPSCAGVADGWTGYDSTNNILYICQGSVARAH